MTYAIVAIAVLILDQAVKYWTVGALAVGETKNIIPGVIEFFHTQNAGAAWGFLDGWSGARWLFVALVVIFCAAVIVMLSKNIIKEPMGRWLLVLIMAGGLGNGIDRAINGYVVDMLHFEFMTFPVFNIADIFVSVCGVILCVWLIMQIFQKPDQLEEPPPPRRRSSRSRDGEGKGDEAPGVDYITQLKRPVVQARVELERPHTAPAAPRETVKMAASSDPFAEFFSEPAPPRRAETVSNAVVSAPKSEPRKSDTDFSLDDIMAEFSDK